MLPRLPRQIMRVERYTMAADARPRIERHKAERLGRRRTHDFPGVDAEGIAEFGHLVCHADVYCSKRVFPELCRLCDAGRRDSMNRSYDLAVEHGRRLGRIIRHPAYDLWNVMRLELRIARIDTFGRECEQKILVKLKAFFDKHR